MAETSTITRETIMAGGLRDAGHLNYGKRGGGTIWQHTTIPRLQAIDRPTLSDEETKRLGVSRLREWSVDGGRAGSLEDAIAALNVPAVLAEEEAEILAFVPEEWTKLVPFRHDLGEKLGREDVATTILTLRHKGFIQNELRPAAPRAEPWIRRAPDAPSTTPDGGARA
ncbi:hypothetical protein [Methylobacterium symbioticum]|uniref:Uncharacterized protein n=1 Tax=Methylobacterium symbioticum TaxID=2584084 RepID=A0A509ECB2_9HYPH|nr:hypothetical protein [Methylobacterium symbioticum]VUD71808.1 hypothetical protein MET9862_02396 [Methylobacterium symbioticum]